MHVKVILAVLAWTVKAEPESLCMRGEIRLEVGFGDLMHVRKQGCVRGFQVCPVLNVPLRYTLEMCASSLLLVKEHHHVLILKDHMPRRTLA